MNDSTLTESLRQLAGLLGGTELVVVFLVSALVSGNIFLGRDRLLNGKRRDDISAVQAAHKSPTPRLGGIAILLGVTIGVLIAPQEWKARYILYSISLAPVFLAGVLEDIGYRLSPTSRILAAASSSLIAVYLLDMWLPRIGIPGLEFAFRFAPFAILFTVFSITGICHAINLIDGLNGLAGGIGVMIAIALAMVARDMGDAEYARLMHLFAAAVLGFLVVNFPFGAVFLGDSGAYAIGHTLGWFAVILIAREPMLSTWAILLIFFWPVADTLFTIWRRRKSGKPADQPDNLHHHQLMMQVIEFLLPTRASKKISNPLATIVILSLAALPTIAGVTFSNSSLYSFIMILLFSIAFVKLYFILEKSLICVEIRKTRSESPTEN